MSVVSQGVPIRALQVGINTAGIETGVLTGSAHAPVNCEGYRDIVIYVKSDAACSAGTLVIEERDRLQDTAGTIATITLATPFAASGGTYAYHLQSACYGYVNCRIGTDSVGGNIIAVLRAC